MKNKESNSEVERACVYGIDSLNSLDNAAEHDVKVNITLELKPEASDITQCHTGVAKKNTNEPKAFAVADKLKTKCVNDTADDSDHNINKRPVTAKTFGTTEETVVDDESEGKGYTQNDFLLISSEENPPKNEFVTQGKYALLVKEYGTSETIVLDTSASPTKITALSNSDNKDAEKMEENNHCKYNDHANEFQGYHAGLRSDYENHGENCFSPEVHMICEHQDLLSERDAIGKEYNIDNSCHHTLSGSDLPSTLCSTSPKHENAEIQTDLSEEFHNDQYENIEFSSIFSSVDVYQRSFYPNYAAENTSLLQETNADGHNFITESDSHSCEKSMADSEVFGLSLNDTRSIEFLQSDGQYSHRAPADKFSIDMQAEQNNSILFRLDDLQPTSTASNIRTNFTSFSDPNSKLVNCLPASHQEYNSGWHSAATAPTVGQSAAALSLHYNHPESSVYDPCLSDYNKNYQKCLYQQSPQAYSATYAEWSPWVRTSAAPYDIQMPFMCSKQATNDGCSVSSTDIVSNLAKPEVVQFMQMEAKDDDEETDDADEISYLPLPFSTKYDNFAAQHLRAESLGIPVYQDENSNAVYGPSVLTPPPSASSTPVPSCSQDSCMSDDVNIFTHWPASHYDTSQAYSSSARACKLKSEQLETSLLSFGLSHGTKRPFPSMADVMRTPRSKRAAHKKCVLEVIDQQRRRSGRPRKNQIQSDKISTTANNNKHRKRAGFKLKSETVSRDGSNGVNNPEVQTEAGSSRTSGIARHNEPLNQHAIEIMTLWFENHLDNPYPSKADKEKMASQGGITENQVKSWFANKRNRTNNTKPKVEKRAMEEKLKEIFRDLKRNNHNPMADNSHVIQQLSGIIQHCHPSKQD